MAVIPARAGSRGIPNKNIRIVCGKPLIAYTIEKAIASKYIDKTIRIPMRPTLRSLNLSNSVAIVVYDIFRQCNFYGLEEISQYFD